jgi:Icc protein
LRFGDIRDSADPVRVLHLTDPHLFADRGGALRGAVTYVTLGKVLDHYRHAGWEADLVALTGDLIQDDTAAAYGHCRKLLSQLGLPIQCVPGNHDVRGMMRDELPAPPFSHCGTAEFGHWLIAGIDSCAAGRAGGVVTGAEITRMKSMIASSDADHVLVCLHHPPVDVGSAWLDSVGLDNGEQVLSEMTDCGRVRMALFGHVHQEYDAMHDGIRVVGTPSTCRQFLPNSDDFAVDDRPPAYRRLTLLPDGAAETEVIWIGDA